MRSAQELIAEAELDAVSEREADFKKAAKSIIHQIARDQTQIAAFQAQMEKNKTKLKELTFDNFTEYLQGRM